MILVGIPKGVSKRHQYFVDKFESLWLKYGHELSEEEQLILNLGFGISGDALSYSAIAKHLNFRDSSRVGRLIEDALKHLINIARKPSLKEDFRGNNQKATRVILGR